MRSTKPAFHSVLDLGLRDVGVRNAPGRQLAHLARWAAPLVPLAFVAAFVLCALLSVAGAQPWATAAFFVSLTSVTLMLARAAVRRAPVAVLRITASGGRQATWLAAFHLALLVPALVIAGRPLLVLPVLGVMAAAGALVLRDRDRVPALLRRLTAALEAGERVEGDGLGADRRARSRSAALTVLAATDRRLLLASSAGIAEVPYAGITDFSVGWRAFGRTGDLALVVDGDRRTIGSIVPANLLSIAQALRAHGVEAEHPDALAEAEVAWGRALAGHRIRDAFFDRAAMATRDFDRGLWLLLAVCFAVFYPGTIGLGFGRAAVAILLVAMPIACVACGYVSRTRSSLAYLVPLNLLLTPTFLFVDTAGVLVMMFALSTLAAIALRAGAALGALRDAPADTTGPARGSLRDAVGGRSLIRLSAILLGIVLAGVTASTAAGVELSSLREHGAKRLPADGRSNLTGGAASLRYAPAGDLRELVADEDFGAGPADGARWELRPKSRAGGDAVILAHYVFVDPRLDDPAAVATFVAEKDREHAGLAGERVTHTERVVDGRTGYVWVHRLRNGAWYSAIWFPQPVHTVRVECVGQRQADRFKRLCAEAVRSLRFAR